MAKSFSELGNKAEVLIEQGEKADQEIEKCQTRVASANKKVQAARQQLVAAGRVDEEGNPKEDLDLATVQLRMAENQLAASERALDAALDNAERIKERKRTHVQEIETHNEIEKSNLEKLRWLKTKAFSENSSALSEGIALRLNQAEDARVELLRSMGIDASPDHVTANYGGGSSRFNSISPPSIDVVGESQGVQSGGAKKISSGIKAVSAPVGGGLAAEELDKVSDESPGKRNDLRDRELEHMLANILSDLSSASFSDNSSIESTCELMFGKIVESPNLTAEQKISRLVGLRRQLNSVAQNYSFQAEATAIKKQGKTLNLSPLEKRQMGERYIDSILEVYRENLLDRGVVSVSALDATISDLRQYYSTELEKEINGQSNRLYVDPNYDELIETINSRRPAIAGISPGDIMTFELANSGHVNPYYGRDKGYSINCQACVVTFEARERGYDVQVLPNTEGSVLEQLSFDTRLAWIDPRTGKHPNYVFDNTRRTPSEYLDFINQVVKPGERYTIQFVWKTRNNSGHIVNLDRTQNGLLRIKDNQRGAGELSEYVGDFAVLGYLSRMRFEEVSPLDDVIPCVPRLLRIDNMDFDFSIVNNIMEGFGDDSRTNQ